MSLPGKLCVGILEEDNPQKSYFRFKPLLVDENGSYVPYAQAEGYPEDGCIRIVPDKNESYHFKARMRRTGLFCVVDLRAHPEENDKIRANKNYHEGGEERNAFIIYSDVVRGPAPGMIFEILPEADLDATRPAPHTGAVLVRGERLNAALYTWQAVEGEEGQARLIPGEAACPLDEMQVFDLPGFGEEILSFAIAPPAKLERVSDLPEPQPPAEKHDEAPKPGLAPEAPKLPKPKKVAREEKPWIHHDSSMLPPPVDPRLSPAQRVLAAQAGLNPRRGRSLRELIEEKWQHSRLNQLGHPVAPIATGAPLVSPVDSAVGAVREVWNQPNLRQDLLASLSGIEEFGASLQECREAARQRDIEQHLESLEARRMALLDELDHLKSGNAEIRERLKREIRRDEAADLAEAMGKTQAAKEEQARYELLAAEARAAAQDARKAVDVLTDEELERRLREFALDEHMLERIEQIRGETAAEPDSQSAQESEPEALTRRVIARFEAEGIELTRLEALNLWVCLAISPVLLIGGPVGSGKTATARLLAEALGWRASKRYAEFAPGKRPLDEAALPEALDMVLLDDANLYPAPDMLRGLGLGDRSPRRLCLTVQDSHTGCPVPANVLDKGFALRLNPKGDAPWQPSRRIGYAEEPPLSLGGALKALLAKAEVPERCAERMDALRHGLGAPVSRRALDDAWRYCAAMIAGLGEAADPMGLLDLAVAQRLLPALLASAPIETLRRLPALLEGLPVSRALLDQPLPVMI